jgi:hypothetical protein
MDSSQKKLDDLIKSIEKMPSDTSILPRRRDQIFRYNPKLSKADNERIQKQLQEELQKSKIQASVKRSKRFSQKVDRESKKWLESQEKNLAQLVENYAQFKSKKPIIYQCRPELTEPFLLLHLIENNKKNICYYGTKYVVVDFDKNQVQLEYDSSMSEKDVRKKILQHYDKCKKNNKILIVPLGFQIGGGGHRNMLIFNPYRNTVERFEPHGTYFSKEQEAVDKVLKKFFRNSGLTYLPPSPACPIGLQGAENMYANYELTSSPEKKILFSDNAGFCCAWSYFYADLVLKFPDFSPEKIKDIAMKTIAGKAKTPESRGKELLDFIRGQNTFLFQKIKKAFEPYNLSAEDFLLNFEDYYPENSEKIMLAIETYFANHFRDKVFFNP